MAMDGWDDVGGILHEGSFGGGGMWRGMGSWRAEMQAAMLGFQVRAEMEKGRVLQEGLVGVASCRPLLLLG